MAGYRSRPLVANLTILAFYSLALARVQLSALLKVLVIVVALERGHLLPVILLTDTRTHSRVNIIISSLNLIDQG